MVSLVIVSIFWGGYYKAGIVIEHQLDLQGKAFFQEILLTRDWIALHNGVYVKPADGERANSYLKMVPGLKTSISDESGQEYILKNPALVTREISEMAAQNDLFRFRITSLHPLNPNNHPDEFESKALQAFESGVIEYSTMETQQAGQAVFRYMAPLQVQAQCLTCHSNQNYQVGDIRGGISISLDAGKTLVEIQSIRSTLIVISMIIIILVAIIIWVIARLLIRQLKDAENILIELATKDELTGLLNRREGYNRILRELATTKRPFSIMLMDIDHFKKVNDRYGHPAGDEVLRVFARTIRETFPYNEINCRNGGEEFLTGLVDTNIGQAKLAAERIRERVSQLAIDIEGISPIQITVSIGVATRQANETMDELLQRADKALYQAKDEGRNRVVAG